MGEFNGKKRSELPDSVFGIPQERKYPMPDEKHTRSAIKLFNHVDPKYEEQLAKAVIKNMKKYGIDGSAVGPNNRLRKYLPKDMIKESMDSLLYEYMYTDNDLDIIIQESGYALTWRIMPILLKAVLSGVDQYDYKYLREKKLPAILKKCKTMDDIKYMRRDAITAKTQLEILKRNVHAVNTNDEQIMKRLNKSFIKKVKDGKITEKEIDTHIRWLGTEYKKLIDARAKEIKDSMKESYIEEGYFKSDKDIYYNKDKFDSGEINLCFITGLSGSGKSTMGRGMSSKDIEHYEMDDIICNYAFSDDNLKEYGGLVESFFKGPGKEYRLKRGDEDHNNAVFDSHENYEKEITQLFVKHAISYCKSHKGIKYVCDGIWIFMFIKPEQLKDCAVYIKGTSSIKSGYRALKRDIDEDKRNGMTSLQIFKHEFKRVKEDILYARENQKELKSFRSYFEKQSTNESYIEESSMPEEIPNNIRELLRRLNSYDYGYIKDGKKIKGMKNFFEDYKSLTISEFEKYQIGVCWDYVHYEAYWFAKNHYKYETFYIQVQDEDNDCPSHTYLVFYLPNSSKVYYFESSWGKYQGIEAFDNINKLHNTIKERHIESARSKCDPKTYFRNKYDAKSSRWEHLSCGEYMVKVSNGRIQLNESYIEEGYFRSTDNLEFNLNKWSKSGPHNLLYITGISGSGKTTLAKEMCKKYKAEYIELDKFTLGIVKGLDRWFEYVNNGTYEVHPLLKEYFSQLDHLTTNGSWSKPDMGNEHDKFLTWLIKKVKGNGTLYIVEGAQFFMKLSNMDPDLIKGEPLIVVGTSAFKSWVRRIKRDTSNDESISRFIYHLKKDVPMLFKYYFSNERDLQEYIKNMYVNEATNYTTQETGISTIIFDIGDVLIRDNFKKFLKSDPDIPNELVDTIKSLWFIAKDDVDDTMDLETYREIVNKRMGVEFSKYIPKLFQYGIDAVEVLDYTIPMIQDLKDKGYKVYYLSNWSAWTHDLLQEAGKFDFLKYMDGGVFSYDVGYRKPDPEIYQILLNRYKINPEEAVFFDDRKENIEAANKMGIHGILFDKHDSAIVYNTLEQFHILYKGAIQSINDISKNHRSYGYNVLQDATVNYMNEISLGTKIDEDKVAKEILNIVRPIIISQENKSKASKMGLTLKCKIEEVDSGMVFVLVLDGSQDRRDTDEARAMLKELASKCKSKLSDLVSKVDIGDGDEGCLYFTMDKNKIKRNRKYLIKESAGEEITKSGINDIKEIISILDDDDFKNFKFTNIAYCDIRYRNSKPIAFITIRTKPVNNCTVGYVSLAVIPKYQDQGIGRSLTKKAIKWFKKNKGIDFLEWHCLPDNAASNRLANDAGFSKYIAKDESEYNTYTMESVVEESKRKNSLYFYHIVDDNADISKGLLSLGYMYKHDKSLFLKNAAKYRNRLCDSWGIYPNRDPESLTAEEIYEGIKLHRNEDNLNTIYFFKFPPYSSLHKEFERLYRCKKIYRIDINDPKVKSIIKNINYGWVDSNMNNKPLDREYYETVSIDDYFDNFDKDKWPLFSTLYHISIEVKNGYIPKSLLTRVNTPKTIEDVKLLETSAIVDRLLRLEPGADPMVPDVGVSLQEYGTTGGAMVGTNQPDSVYIVNYMQNNVFSGHKEQKQAICKKGMNQMYTTKNGKSVPVDKNKFKEEASNVSVFKFKESPLLSYDEIIESAIRDSDYYSLLTGDTVSSPDYIKYDNRFIQEESFIEYLDDIECCTESTLTGALYTNEYPYMKVLTESVDGRCWNYYNDINGYFVMNELTGLRSPSYGSIGDIPESQIKLIERGTVYLGE